MLQRLEEAQLALSRGLFHGLVQRFKVGNLAAELLRHSPAWVWLMVRLWVK